MKRSRQQTVTKAFRDRAARDATAFKDYDTLVKACREDGYVPTLILNQTDLKTDFAIQVLRKGLNQENFRIWPDFGSYPGEHSAQH